MIINFHPKEIESQYGLETINQLKQETNQEVFHSTDKSNNEWQNIIKSDEKIILVAPLYWWGLSYEFDKWLQGVFSYNFAYTFDNGSKEGLLNGRSFEIHVTHGTPNEYAQKMKENVYDRLKNGIFEYCGANININFKSIR